MRNEIGIFDAYHETLEKLSGIGILLVAGEPPNSMTIGWGTIGEIWNMPVFTVLVRPTRYTFQLMEESTSFTICVLSSEFKKQLAVCGSKSGRDINKIKACGFKMNPGIRISTPYIEESHFHYECRIVHKHRIDPLTLAKEIDDKYYPGKDWHMVYYGQIAGVFKNQ